MPSPESEAVLRLNSELRDAWLADPNYTIEDLRRIFEEWLGQLAIPGDTKFTDVTCNGVRSIWADAPSADPDRVIVHFHSGGYVVGSAKGYRSFGGHLSGATGCRVLLAGYRLAPDHPSPAGVDDGIAVYKWLLSGGYSPEKIVLCGDSGGGGLVLAALQKLRDQGVALPAAGIAISPLTDFARTGESYQSNIPHDPLVTTDFLGALGTLYCGDRDPRDPELSPLYGDWSGLPPLLILAGEIEMMRDDGKLAAQAAQRAGVDATYFEGEGMAHIWTLYADRLPEAREGLALIAQFVNRHTRES